MYMYSVHEYSLKTLRSVHEYSIKTLRKKDKATQHNTNPETTFFQELHLRWDSNTRLMHSRCDPLPTELLRQLSWLSSNHPYKSKQTKAKQVSQPDKQVHVYVHVHVHLRVHVCILLTPGCLQKYRPAVWSQSNSNYQSWSCNGTEKEYVQDRITKQSHCKRFTCTCTCR